MKKEIERITKLFEEKKISETEYTNLLNSIKGGNKKSNIWKNILIDPFSETSFPLSLIVAVSVLIVISFVGLITDSLFPGTFDLRLGYFEKLGLLNLAIQNIVIVVVTSIWFLLGALIFRCKNIRIVDIFISISTARYPYIVVAILLGIYTKLFGGNFKEFYPSLMIIFPVTFGGAIWLGVLYFKALKFSFGVSGKVLWIIFIVGLLFSEITTVSINKRFILGQILFDNNGINTEVKKEQLKIVKHEAEEWLKLIDQKKYEDSWYRTSLYFQKAISKEKWSKMVAKNEGEIGLLTSRRYLKTKFDEDNRKMVSVIYSSNYSIIGEIIENVVLKKQTDNSWKVEGYWLK